MKKFKQGIFTVLTATVLVGGSLFLNSCGDAEETLLGCSVSKLTDLSEVVSEKASAYGSNPTSATCAAYKTAMQNYINEADDCIYADEAYVSQLQASLNSLDCSK